MRASLSCALALCLLSSGCASYWVKSKSYLTDVNYAQPPIGKFRVIKRDLKVAVEWDSDDPNLPPGSEQYMVAMTSLLTTAMAQLVRQANLQDNQALSNVRISSPGVTEQYMAYFVLGFAIWREHRHAVMITADVIEFTG